MIFQERDYQDAAVNSVFEYFAEGNEGNPIVAMPTGTGKSLVLAMFIKRALRTYPGTRIMKLTHVKELIEQNLDKLLSYWPTAPAGVFSAGLNRKEFGHPIVFGGVKSVAKVNDLSQFGRIDLLLIDECHLVSMDEKAQYSKVIFGLMAINPNLKVIGLTATYYRGGQGLLTEGDNRIFTDVCFDLTDMESFNWLIDSGYLCTLIPKKTELEYDTSGVSIRAGEFNQKELQESVDKEHLTYSAINECVTYGHDRHAWLMFASGIQHTEHTAEIMDGLGVSTTYVHSKMLSRQRDKNIADFKAGKYLAMVNNGILTTGFDYPAIDLIGVLRPTKSTSLWVQMLGRGTRPMFAPGYDLQDVEGRLASIQASQKQNCLVMDFAKNSLTLGPINNPVLPRPKGKKAGTAPVKVCPECSTYNPASVRICQFCSYEFPQFLKIGQRAATKELIARPAEIVTKIFEVKKVVYAKHNKEGRPPSVKVTYACGVKQFKDWICIEHGNYPAKRARDWWRGGIKDEFKKRPLPVTTDELLERLEELEAPTHLRVWLRGDASNAILAYDYTGTAFGENNDA